MGNYKIHVVAGPFDSSCPGVGAPSDYQDILRFLFQEDSFSGRKLVHDTT